jgi:hypothetical protein
MRINSDGNVLIAGNIGLGGTTPTTGFISPETGYAIRLPLNGTATFNNNSSSVIFTGSGASGDYLAGTLNFQSRGDGTGRDINFINGATPTLRMRINSSGNVGINTTTPVSPLHVKTIGNGTAGVFTETIDNPTQASANAFGLNIIYSGSVGQWSSGDGQNFIRCADSAERFKVLGSGNVQNTNNSYGSLSDIKLKQDVIDASSQWNDIKLLRVRKFRYKNDPTGFLQIGVIAQELEEFSPNLIEESKDYEYKEVPVLDDNGNPVLKEDGTPEVTKEHIELDTTTKSVKYSILYMKAVKALQEAMERIEQLETKTTSLEARLTDLES